MKYQYANPQLFFRFAAAVLLAAVILAGCAPQVQKPMRICPGAESVTDALSLLRARSQNIVPLRANGQCRLQYYADGKPHKENFPVKLWVNPVRSPRRQAADAGRFTSNGANPPAQIYLQGDVAFDPKGLVAGSNEQEFWLSIKPKEVSSYWWGRWSQANSSEKLMFSPELIIEALGIAEVGGGENWSLSNEGVFDVLTKRDGRGVVIKKVYIFNCDHLVSKIEYFDTNGRAVAIMELGEYKEVSEWFSVPAAIKIINRMADGAGGLISITISLKSVKSAHFTEKALRRLFTRPEPRGFKHIYKIVDGKIIEQPR